jgi:hypothetical protein
MGPLVAVGGLHVAGSRVREVEVALDKLCAKFGFPDGEEFKWSPDRKMWMHKGLVSDERSDFFLKALRIARKAEAAAIVVAEDTGKRLASSKSKSHAADVTMMFLERAQSQIAADNQAVVVFDRSGGGHRVTFDFLSSCIAMMRSGTAYTKLDRLALALSTDSKLSRLVQLADVVVACTTGFVAGEERWSPVIFEKGILPLLRQDLGRKGGCGLKLHPDKRYGNLYHWLLGDETLWKGSVGVELPSTWCTCYSDSADVA